MMARPLAAVIEPDVPNLTSPPPELPAAEDLPDSIKIASEAVLPVLTAWLICTLPLSVTRLILPSVRLMALLTVSALPEPVIVALTLPVPRISLLIVVAAERR